MTDANSCPTCRIVSTVCFWGPYKVAAWKRPALLILSILVIAGLLLVALYTDFLGNATWPWLLFLPSLGLGILGLVTSLRGCMNCVSRIFGGV